MVFSFWCLAYNEDTKLRPKKNVLCTPCHTFSANYSGTQTSRLKYEIKYDPYTEIAQFKENLKNLKFGLRGFLRFLTT